MPVIPTVARQGEGIDALLKAATEVATGARRNRPHRIRSHPAAVEDAIDAIEPLVAQEFPELPNARWVALRLLNADERVTEAVRSGEIGQLGGIGYAGQPRLAAGGAEAPVGAGGAGGAADATLGAREGRERILKAATRSRWTLRPGFHDVVAENIYREAAADRGQERAQGLEKGRHEARPRPRPLAHQPGVRLPANAGDPRSGVLAHDRGRERPLKDACRPSPRSRPPSAPGLRGLGRDALVAQRLPLRWGLPRHCLGGERDAAAHGHLLPPLHAPRGLRLPAAGCLQPRFALPAGGRARKASAHHEHGLRLQRRRRGRHEGDRQSQGTAHRDHHQQFLPVQRAVADPDPDRDHLHRGAGPASPGRRGLGGRGRRHRAAGHLLHVPHLVGALQHGAERRSHNLLAGASPLPPPAHPADALHLDDRPAR